MFDNSNMKLINKKWKEMNMAYSLPNEEQNGNIESTDKVLSLKQKRDCSYGKIVKLQERGKSSRSGCNSTNESEMWLRTKADEEGFFLLKNLATGKYLTANNDDKFIVTGTIHSLSTIKETFSHNISTTQLGLF